MAGCKLAGMSGCEKTEYFDLVIANKGKDMVFGYAYKTDAGRIRIVPDPLIDWKKIKPGGAKFMEIKKRKKQTFEDTYSCAADEYDDRVKPNVTLQTGTAFKA